MAAMSADGHGGRMAKKHGKGVRPERSVTPRQKAVTQERWTVRGVAGPLQKAAADAARAEGLTLGVWVSLVLQAAVAGREPATATAEWRAALEARVARLEAAGLAPG
jgi:hypothetical protein